MKRQLAILFAAVVLTLVASLEARAFQGSAHGYFELSSLTLQTPMPGGSLSAIATGQDGFGILRSSLAQGLGEALGVAFGSILLYGLALGLFVLNIMQIVSLARGSEKNLPFILGIVGGGIGGALSLTFLMISANLFLGACVVLGGLSVLSLILGIVGVSRAKSSRSRREFRLPPRRRQAPAPQPTPPSDDPYGSVSAQAATVPVWQVRF